MRFAQSDELRGRLVLTCLAFSRKGGGDRVAGVDVAACDLLCERLRSCSEPTWIAICKGGRSSSQHGAGYSTLSHVYLEQYMKLNKLKPTQSIAQDLRLVINCAQRKKRARESREKIRAAMRIAASKMFKESCENLKRNTRVELLAPISPAPDEMIDCGLGEMLSPGPKDILYDLGCGDGRWLVTAALRYGCKCVGIEVDDDRIRLAKAQVERYDVADLVDIRKDDLLTANIGNATIVVAYLFPEGVAQLGHSICDRVKPGTPLLLPGFCIPDSPESRSKKPRLLRKSNISDGRPIYLYEV